jgi:phospholipid/cholesterol/gamma-HCH transport system substrate-binding protein
VIGDVIDNLTSVLTTVGSRDTELSNLILQLQQFVSGLAQDRSTIGDSINGVNALATSTAGLLSQVRAPLAKDITDLSALAAKLNQNSGPIKYVIQNMPNTAAAVIRAASYGSWLNFYLCTVEGYVTLPGGKQLTIPLSASAQPRCK